MYDETLIRTGNMPALRDTDIVFDEEVEPSLTQQHLSDECDFNTIVRRGIPELQQPLQFADVSEVVGYEEALQTVMKAQESFSALPAEIRARFENDPRNFVAFMSDDANVQEAIKMGLAVEKVKDEPIVTKTKEESANTATT